MNKNLPIYMQLVESIKKKIVSGDLKIGERLVSEREMSLQYGINRMTVRNALKQLKNEGIIEARRGSGNYIIKVPTLEDKLQLGQSNAVLSLSMQIRQNGMKSSRQMISFKKIFCEGALKDTFPNEDKLYEIVRLSLINDNPYAFQKAYIPCSVFKEAERFDFESFSLYKYMEDQGHRPDKVISYLQIVSIPDEYADIMNVNKDKKVFLFDYYGFDKDHGLVEYTISYHLPEYTSFKYVSKKSK